MDLPDRYPSYQTCHRRFQAWVDRGTLRQVLKALATDRTHARGLDLSEAFIDGSFASAKKKAVVSAKPSAAKGPQIGNRRPRCLPLAITYRLGLAARTRRANAKRQLPAR